MTDRGDTTNKIKMTSSGASSSQERRLHGATGHAGIKIGVSGALSGPAIGSITGHGPEFDVPKARPVTVRLVTHEDQADCSFWVGLSMPGSLSPLQLMDVGQVPTMLFEAAAKGLNEHGPVMLSDTSVEPARYVYLIPAPSSDFRERAIWLQELIKTVKSWAPQAAGFYISPELVAAKDSHELLLQILREIILHSLTSSFYLLLGSHGMNAVLNAALRLKSELDSETLNILVYH